jgi:hypothetical protein
MKWEDIVKIQYDAMQRSSVIYILILSAIAALSNQLILRTLSKIFIIISIGFVLTQNIYTLFLTDTQRQSSWRTEHKIDSDELNKKENRLRKTILYLSIFTTVSILATITSIFLK